MAMQSNPIPFRFPAFIAKSLDRNCDLYIHRQTGTRFLLTRGPDTWEADVWSLWVNGALSRYRLTRREIMEHLAQISA